MQKLVFDRGYKENQIGEEEKALISINTSDEFINASLNESVMNI